MSKVLVRCNVPSLYGDHGSALRGQEFMCDKTLAIRLVSEGKVVYAETEEPKYQAFFPAIQTPREPEFSISEPEINFTAKPEFQAKEAVRGSHPETAAETEQDNARTTGDVSLSHDGVAPKVASSGDHELPESDLPESGAVDRGKPERAGKRRRGDAI